MDKLIDVITRLINWTAYLIVMLGMTLIVLILWDSKRSHREWRRHLETEQEQTAPLTSLQEVKWQQEQEESVWYSEDFAEYLADVWQENKDMTRKEAVILYLQENFLVG